MKGSPSNKATMDLIPHYSLVFPFQNIWSIVEHLC